MSEEIAPNGKAKSGRRASLKKKILIIVCAALLLLAAVPLFLCLRANIRANRRLRGKPRREWKDKAIADISLKSADSGWIESQLAELKSTPADAWPESPWLSDNFLLMKNGEHIIYSSIYYKPEMDRHIFDLFIGRGSDGKWYYTTYHFCVGMLWLRDRLGQPESLDDFIETCYLKEFDGRSDECLNRTWPPPDQ